MFQDLVVIIIGGDCREVELYRCWKESGPVVKMLGFEEARRYRKRTWRKRKTWSGPGS